MISTLILGLLLYTLAQVVTPKTNLILYLGAGLVLILGGILSTPLFSNGYEFKIGENQTITSVTSGNTTITTVSSTNVYDSNIFWDYLMPLLEICLGLLMTIDAALPKYGREQEHNRTTFNR